MLTAVNDNKQINIYCEFCCVIIFSFKRRIITRILRGENPLKIPCSETCAEVIVIQDGCQCYQQKFQRMKKKNRKQESAVIVLLNLIVKLTKQVNDYRLMRASSSITLSILLRRTTSIYPFWHSIVKRFLQLRTQTSKDNTYIYEYFQHITKCD